MEGRREEGRSLTGKERGRAPTCGSHYQTLRWRKQLFPLLLLQGGGGGGGSSLRANSKASKWFGGMERVRHEIYEKTRITPRALY